MKKIVDKEAAAAVRKYKRDLKRESARIIQLNTAQRGDQHARCSYCGRSYLVTVDLEAGVACGPCKYIVTWLPQPAKQMLDAIVYRVTALEQLRQVHENDLTRLGDELHRTVSSRLKAIETELFRRRRRKGGARKGRR